MIEKVGPRSDVDAELKRWLKNLVATTKDPWDRADELKQPNKPSEPPKVEEPKQTP